MNFIDVISVCALAAGYLRGRRRGLARELINTALVLSKLDIVVSGS
jgi:uncharacterized membrane protein required for colicin V production